MSSPLVPAFKIIFSDPSSHSNIINSLLIDQFKALWLWKYLLVFLDNLFARKTRNTLPESFSFLEVVIFDYAASLLVFFDFFGCTFFGSWRFWLRFMKTAAGFACGGNFARGVEVGVMFVSAGRFDILSHGFGWEAVTFMVGEGVKEIRDIHLIPGVGFLVFVKFDFQVYLHQYNNCTTPFNQSSVNNQNMLFIIIFYLL